MFRVCLWLSGVINALSLGTFERLRNRCIRNIEVTEPMVRASNHLSASTQLHGIDSGRCGVEGRDSDKSRSLLTFVLHWNLFSGRSLYSCVDCEAFADAAIIQSALPCTSYCSSSLVRQRRRVRLIGILAFAQFPILRTCRCPLLSHVSKFSISALWSSWITKRHSITSSISCQLLPLKNSQFWIWLISGTVELLLLLCRLDLNMLKEITLNGCCGHPAFLARFLVSDRVLICIPHRSIFSAIGTGVCVCCTRMLLFLLKSSLIPSFWTTRIQVLLSCTLKE